MTNESTSPEFSNRYRFEQEDDDWDRGRSGFTRLVYDLEYKRKAVIKRAETFSKKKVDELKNEESALDKLKDLGVPKVYDLGSSQFDGKEYRYIIIEYIDGIRVERDLTTLTIAQRARIITQLFDLLAQAHQRGIVNGDVDLKHLFLRKKGSSEELVVIDWGNAKVGLNPRQKDEFAYDLARAAEVIYALVTQAGEPPVVGSIALPDESKLLPGFENLPKEFLRLCSWAPRTPTSGTSSPYTARELADVSRVWSKAILENKKYKQPSAFLRTCLAVGVLLLVAIPLVVWGGSRLLAQPTVTPTEVIISPDTPLPVTLTSTEAAIDPTFTVTPTETATQEIVASPSVVAPLQYSPFLTLDQNAHSSEADCWINSSTAGLGRNEGLYPREKEGWGFRIFADKSVEEMVQTDLSGCVSGRSIDAIALNVIINRLEYPDIEASHEFGFFMEDSTGNRREYTLWMDKTHAIYLRVRDGAAIADNLILVISAENLKFGGDYPRPYTSFPVKMFLEINNSGQDILYLLDSSFDIPKEISFDPGQMIRMDSAILPSLTDVKSIGILGYGGKTETIVWPLMLLERK